MSSLSKIKISNKSLDIIKIIVGSVFFAIAVKFFFEPHNLVIGGVAGISIIVEHIGNNFGTKIPIFLSNLLLNIPLIFLGFKLKGKKFVDKTIFSIIILTITFFICDYIPIRKTDLFLSTVFGGIFEGLGVGIVFTAFGTTGGSAIAASILHLFFKHINISWILFIIDASIIILGFLVFGIEKAMYSVIAVCIAMKISDVISEGIHFAKAVFIISDKSGDISENIIKNLHRGITSFKAKGRYTSKDKDVLLCVIDKKELGKMKEIVKLQDEKAFVFVTNVTEVLGEGFISKN